MVNGRDRNRGALPAAARARTVALYPIRGHHRSELTCGVMAEGARRAGFGVVVIPEDRWQGGEDADIGCLYGLEGNTPAIFKAYCNAHGGRMVYVDLGYWGRREGGRWTGYHKVIVNDRHPNLYLQEWKAPPDRLARFHVEPQPRRTAGEDVLVCGMSDKGARAVGYEPEQWERQMIESLHAVTTRQIVYRPKPSWKDARPLPGAGYSGKERTFEQQLAFTHAVVTRHSNCALEAMLAGVPAWASDGVAALARTWELGQIDQATLPTAEALRQLARNIAYTQWSIEEMRQGLPWQHLTARGLV